MCSVHINARTVNFPRLLLKRSSAEHSEVHPVGAHSTFFLNVHSTNTVHSVRGLHMQSFSITPPCRQSHPIFRGDFWVTMTGKSNWQNLFHSTTARRLQSNWIARCNIRLQSVTDCHLLLFVCDLFMYLLKAYSPVYRTGSPQGCSLVQISHKLDHLEYNKNMHTTQTQNAQT